MNEVILARIGASQKYMRCVFLFLLIFEGLHAQQVDHDSTRSIHVLTIGNSFANNACKYLEEIVQSVTHCHILITKANIGGCSLEKHANLIEACEQDPGLKPYGNTHSLKDLLLQDKYDYITIQQVSSQSFMAHTFEPHANKLINYISKYAPGAQVLVHQTWAYSPDAERLLEWNLSRQSMHDSLVHNYTVLSQKYDLGMLPSGSAFFHSFNKRSNYKLWSSDGYHANENGCYLAGCVWFTQLFQETTRKITYFPEGLDKKKARFFKRIARRQLRAHPLPRS
ncbi:MAG: DUF4886 domain-containing protein [Saprospiraceae bacterium]|nr:DUF4886 domain-containing protein [Saprospiraceae bacterium]